MVLPYINMNSPQVYTCSPSWTLLPPLSPYHPSESSQCTSLKHPISFIEPGLATRFIYDIIHVSMPFSQIIPPSPSPITVTHLFFNLNFVSLFKIFNFLLFYFLTLQYCIGFAIYQHESTTSIHVPILNPPPSSLPVPSLWVVPVHQTQASSIVHWTWTGDSFHIWYYTCFNAISQIIPPSPSPTESKSLFYTTVSLLLSRIQGYCYHLSKFHIYALVYCIGVFPSGLLHSV